MKRFVSSLFFIGLASCATLAPGIVLFAQQLPVTDHAVWDVEPAIYSVTNYIVTVDGTPQNFAPTSCGPTTCSAPIVLSTFGPHQVTVAAQNLALSTDPTSTQTGPAASVSFSQSQPAPLTTHTTVTK